MPPGLRPALVVAGDHNGDGNLGQAVCSGGSSPAIGELSLPLGPNPITGSLSRGSAGLSCGLYIEAVGAFDRLIILPRFKPREVFSSSLTGPCLYPSAPLLFRILRSGPCAKS
jgi:hypothetical protein